MRRHSVAAMRRIHFNLKFHYTVWLGLSLLACQFGADVLAAASAPPLPVPSLHERIDAVIESEFAGPLTPPAREEDFLRRVYLDLTGRIPTAVEARAFFADAASDKLLGVHIMGPQAGEMIHEAAITMSFGGASEDIARTCHAHPTRSEAVRQAAMDVEGWMMQA